MKKKYAVASAAVFTGAWYYLGYIGWTWIPIGKKPRDDQIRVACVGDSITYGAMIKNWYEFNYPELLGKKLGGKYCVHNYGLSERTGMETGDHPYIKEFRHRRSMHFAPDIVCLMFGTNDSKPQNWKGKEEFKRQYEKLVNKYRNLPSRPTVILMAPPSPHCTDGKQTDNYSFDIRINEVMEAGEASKELAEKYKLPFVDLFLHTTNHPEWFVKDGIHPNRFGSEEIASLLKSMILNLDETRYQES